MDKFDVVLADPPWEFKVWNEQTGSGRSASQHYQIMSIDDICNLPVKNISADNCALFLWTTWATLFKYAPRVIDSWGFTYRTEAWVWVKALKSGDDFAMGTGYYSRSNSEPCLLAVKGTMPVTAHDVLALIYSPRRAHSQKPDEQYDKIERLYPNMRYLELFARNKNRAGWSYWGNEVESDIDLLGRKVMDVHH